MAKNAYRANLISTAEPESRTANVGAAQYLDANDLEELTGTPASTWRYWAKVQKGPLSFRIGKRRVWRRAVVEAWLEEQENAARA